MTVVANLRKLKGHDVLVDASPAILPRFPDARFELIGEGTERMRSRPRRRAGVAVAFTFVGGADTWRRDWPHGIFVLPSRSDASPNAVVEAMAAGLPIVASSVGGIVELVEHDVTGLLVPPELDALLAAI